MKHKMVVVVSIFYKTVGATELKHIFGNSLQALYLNYREKSIPKNDSL